MLVTGLLNMKNRFQALLRNGITLALLGKHRNFGGENHAGIKCYGEGENCEK